ncbi:MAG: hypothetical protein GY903_31285 [Fuerstiella sp.]|nr:hypothetical protein [Fuerstiella sp.]MCP4858977.1 hypothetical protein [Fuerstiella sp.]
MRNQCWSWIGAVAIVGLFGAFAKSADTNTAPQFRVEESFDISEVPSGFPVGFCLLTHTDRQYVAYYDKERRMTVASRSLDSKQWQYQILPSNVGWDSHNYVTMAVDRDGHLHVSGNMHNVTLIYFRTETAGEISTLKKLAMTGEQEERACYPHFLTDAQGDLIFNYRHGGSGNGMRIYNRYDSTTRTWSRLLDKPLLNGEGERNAYPLGPLRGPKGAFHLVWVWRDTPDCSTNHHLSYARSTDLVHWESAAHEKLELPLTLNNESLWVDPVASGGGIINGCEKLAFDSEDRPIISYHRSDANGNMQIYASRFENGQWVRHVLTTWNKPVDFRGRGSMGFIGIRISGLSKAAPGLFTMSYRHRDYGSGRLVIDEKTLRPTRKQAPTGTNYPSQLKRPESAFEGIAIRRANDIGASGDAGVRYILQWETLGSNHDRARTGPLPEPGLLRLYRLSSH